MSIEFPISTFTNLTLQLNVNWSTFTNGASGSAVPVNLTGFQALLQVRQFPGAPTALFTVGSFPNTGITLTPPASGNIGITISPSNYVGIGTGTFSYDLLMIAPSGVQSVILFGDYTLSAGVTQNQTTASTSASGNPIIVADLTVTDLLTAQQVEIFSGTMDDTVIGGLSPNSGSFTTLSNSVSASFKDMQVIGTAVLPENSTGVTAATGSNNGLLATTQFVLQSFTYSQPSQLNGVPIGQTTPDVGSFTTLDSTTLSISGSASFGNVNIPGGIINNTPIGQTIRAPGSFTTLTVSSSATLPAATTGVTAPTGSFNNLLATTQYVQQAILGSIAGVASFNTRQGQVTLESADVVGALGFDPANPTNVAISGGQINNTEIGNITPSTGAFTTLSVSSSATITNPVIHGGTIDNTPIGLNTPNTAQFTSAVATTAATTGNQLPQWQQILAGNNAGYINQAANRALNTVFTNSKSRPIFVSVAVVLVVNDSATNVVVDGLLVGQHFNGGAGELTLTHAFIVPAGSTYEVQIDEGTIQIEFWAEL
jgi:hypothetical protein